LKTKVVLHNIDSGRCTTIASSSTLATAADDEDLMVVVMEVGEEGNNNVEYEGADSGGVLFCIMVVCRSKSEVK